MLRRIAVPLALMLWLLGGLVEAQRPSLPASLSVNVGEYYGVVYAERSPTSPYVFYTGERITVRLEVFNENTDVLHLVTNGLRADNAFDSHVTKAPSTQAQGGVRVAFAPAARLGLASGVRAPVPFDASIELPGRGRLIFEAGVEITNPQEGDYEIGFQPRFRSERGVLVAAAHSMFGFEVRRVRNSEDAIELLRRHAMTAYRSEDYFEANRRLDRLLSTYPQSYLAHVIKGHIALKSQSNSEALQAYSRALTLLTSRADRYYIARASAHAVDEEIGTLRATIERLRNQ